jgi:hypothetical protein
MNSKGSNWFTASTHVETVPNKWFEFTVGKPSAAQHKHVDHVCWLLNDWGVALGPCPQFGTLLAGTSDNKHLLTPCLMIPFNDPKVHHLKICLSGENFPVPWTVPTCPYRSANLLARLIALTTGRGFCNPALIYFIK